MSKEQTQLAEKQAATPLGQIKQYINQDVIKGRFEDMLGKQSSAFLNALVNIVSNSKYLQKCNPDTIMKAAIIPATLKLSIEPSLGQGYIVPYKDTATFIIGYKGIVQLCIRSGQYKTIHCSEIYADELKSYNPITNAIEFNDPSEFKMRYSKNPEQHVVGHYAFFELVTGFAKADYMTHEQAMEHGKRFSEGYKYDLGNKKKTSLWSTNPIAAGNKTVLKRLLTRFGIMSVEIRDTIEREKRLGEFDADSDEMKKKIENEQATIPADFEPENGQPEEAPEPEKPKTSAKRKNKKPKYKCNACGLEFDEPKISGKGENTCDICPECFIADFSKNK